MEKKPNPAGPSGAEFKRFIKEINPDREELYVKLDISRTKLFDMYKKDVIPWARIAEVHRVLSQQYFYNIKDYFPNAPDFPDIPRVEGLESNLVRALQSQVNALEKKNVELTERLNLAYERIVTGFFDKSIATYEEQMKLFKQVIDKLSK